MTWAVLSINNKGGTGKSTVAVELAEEMKTRGYDVGLMDADIDSANLATRLGCDKKVEFEGDHIIKPVEHNGMKLYSMENAFEESTFSQSGRFFKEVIDNMVNHSNWGELDYMVVDCPPGSSDVFDEVVRALRAYLKGAISVGQPDAVDDTARLVKVCNHNWIPILGFIENMSGMVCHGQPVMCSPDMTDSDGGLDDMFAEDDEENSDETTSHRVEPFGSGTIEEFSEAIGGNFLGNIPLVVDDANITDHDNGTIENAVNAIEESKEPQMPDETLGEVSFIKNLWNIIHEGVGRMNEQYDISTIQNKFGVEERDPLVMELQLTDAGPISSRILDKVVLTIDNGEVKPMKESTAKRKGYGIEAGMEITSQDLYDALRGEKEVMRSVTGEVTTEDYSIIKAVQMGDASVWGERAVNRLAVLDKILTEVIDMDEIRDIMVEA